MGRIILSAALSLVFCGSAAHAALIGPTPYLESSDSPFDGVSFGAYFHLEDFEDHLLNVPGVTASSGGVTSIVFGPAIHDSVDADDGFIDGSKCPVDGLQFRIGFATLFAGAANDGVRTIQQVAFVTGNGA